MAVKNGKKKTLAEQIAELEDPMPQDFDPEDINNANDAQSSSDSDGDEDQVAFDGREHYQDIGKSKLRKPHEVKLGPEYEGARVSRGALKSQDMASSLVDDDDDDDDDDASGSGDEDEFEAPDDAEKESDEEDSNLSHEHETGASGNESTEQTDLEDGGSEDESEEDEPENETNSKEIDRAELRRLMASDQKAVTESLMQATRADADKGKAVKRQRLCFDSLLNTRIKLQKGLTAVNALPKNQDDNSVDRDSVKLAETAALNLWSTIEELRCTLADAQSSSKRKREPAPTTGTPLSTIWDRMESLERSSRPHRRGVLNKWSAKTRATRTTLANTHNKLLNGNSEQQTLTAVLDSYASSEADKQRSTREENGVAVFDDSPFYQSLLRGLVEERMSASMFNGGDDLERLQQQLPSRLALGSTKVNVAGMRKDKVKRAVDTKASKGRKMRYNVHEKLQNFMAPEDRGTWGDRAREEFFASLLGRSATAVLGENEDVSDEEMDDVAESGLRLFRS